MQGSAGDEKTGQLPFFQDTSAGETRQEVSQHYEKSKKKRYTDRLEIRHNPELVDLFAVELPDECLGRMVDVLARGEKPGTPGFLRQNEVAVEITR